PFPPFTEIDELGERYLVAHEASHGKWSGRYTTKRIKKAERQRFHSFVNAIEDIRCDRLSERQFGGFRAAKLHVRGRLRANHDASRAEKWDLVHAVGINAIYSFDVGLPPQGGQLAKDASTRLWPKLDRIANVA